MIAGSKANIGAVLLAAGGSSRLGRPKQLLPINGKTLLRRAAEMLVDSCCSHSVVVLGAETEISSSELSGLNLSVCVNHDWADGMSTSIKVGLNELLSQAPDIDAVIIALCDQPNISTADIDRLAAGFDARSPQIVAAKYNETLGVPALFPRKHFDDLRDLSGDQGARSLLRSQAGLITTVKMLSASADIDTPDDVAKLEL